VRNIITLILALALAACAHRTPPGPPEFQVGYSDGCDTGLSEAALLRAGPRLDRLSERRALPRGVDRGTRGLHEPLQQPPLTEGPCRAAEPAYLFPGEAQPPPRLHRRGFLLPAARSI
jgi:hypothetical protein